MRTNWTSRLAKARAALFRDRTRKPNTHGNSGEPDRITVRFREHG
jgi:hypothetical protein